MQMWPGGARGPDALLVHSHRTHQIKVKTASVALSKEQSEWLAAAHLLQEFLALFLHGGTGCVHDHFVSMRQQRSYPQSHPSLSLFENRLQSGHTTCDREKNESS
jgi:hypothetical protein